MSVPCCCSRGGSRLNDGGHANTGCSAHGVFSRSDLQLQWRRARSHLPCSCSRTIVMASLAMRVQQESGVFDRHKSNEVRGDMLMHVSAVLHVESDVGQQQHTARVELA